MALPELDLKLQIEIERQRLSKERGNSFVGYNDPDLVELIPHYTDPAELTPGTSGRESMYENENFGPNPSKQ